MKRFILISKIAGAVLVAGLGVYVFFSARSCIEERRWLALGPIENHPVRIWDVKFAKEFNDKNDAQLEVAQAIGVPPVKNREEAERLKSKLVKLEATDTYVIDSLTHSIPYLIPSAKELLDDIGRIFQDSLSAKGLNPNKLIVTSVLRTEDDIAALRKRNVNASENSTHSYGTSFDLSYWRYVKIPEFRGRPYEDVPPEYLRATLSQVLKDIHDQGNRCFVKYEKQQNCFHITVKQ
ncbi:MAG: hypothetical protein J6S97_01700 [Bacteroidales bacterium]|nr:hypothetical protein [Bacteroidales bacterium]MBP5382086.1 hypothetical protein [Bacteroidales bacterium]